MNGEKNAYLVVFSLSGISVLFVLILQMVSAVVVGLAIKRIRAFVNAGNTNDEIKVSQLFKHVAALGLNVLGGLTYIISSAFLITAKYNAIDEQETGKQLAWVNASVILTNTLSFASQLFLCWIFWNLASKEPEQTPEVKTEQSEYSAESRLSGEPVVLIEECDENSDLQARLWNQFIRRKQVNEFILARVDRDGNYTGGMVVNTEQIKQSMVSSIVSRSSAQSEKDIYARYKTANNQPTEELMIVRIQDNTATSIIDEEKV